MEICDVYDENGTRTGRTAARGTVLPAGEYFQVVQVWIRDEAGAYLIQQRALHLASAPGMWATTAGYVVAGEESALGAAREVREELGVEVLPDQLSLFQRLKMSSRFEDVWLAGVVAEHLGRPNPGDEVCNWMWATKPEIRGMIAAGTFFGYSYFEALPE